MRCRVNVYTADSPRGPHKLTCSIEDAAEVSFAENVNAAGELFFTLPYDHAANDLIEPRVSHIEIQRQEQVGLPWETLARGVISHFDLGPNDIIWYAQDYLALFAGSLHNTLPSTPEDVTAPWTPASP